MSDTEDSKKINQDMLTVSEMAEILGMDLNMVKNHIARGVLVIPKIVLGHKTHRFYRDDVMALKKAIECGSNRWDDVLEEGDRYVSIQETCEIFGVHRQFISMKRFRGEFDIPSKRIGSRVKYKLSDITKLLHKTIDVRTEPLKKKKPKG